VVGGDLPGVEEEQGDLEVVGELLGLVGVAEVTMDAVMERRQY